MGRAAVRHRPRLSKGRYGIHLVVRQVGWRVRSRCAAQPGGSGERRRRSAGCDDHRSGCVASRGRSQRWRQRVRRRAIRASPAPADVGHDRAAGRLHRDGRARPARQGGRGRVRGNHRRHADAFATPREGGAERDPGRSEGVRAAEGKPRPARHGPRRAGQGRHRGQSHGARHQRQPAAATGAGADRLEGHAGERHGHPRQRGAADLDRDHAAQAQRSDPRDRRSERGDRDAQAAGQRAVARTRGRRPAADPDPAPGPQCQRAAGRRGGQPRVRVQPRQGRQHVPRHDRRAAQRQRGAARRCHARPRHAADRDRAAEELRGLPGPDAQPAREPAEAGRREAGRREGVPGQRAVAAAPGRPARRLFRHVVDLHVARVHQRPAGPRRRAADRPQLHLRRRARCRGSASRTQRGRTSGRSAEGRERSEPGRHSSIDERAGRRWPTAT